ncbi:MULTISPECIES: sugar-binding transcriptional regulator [Actinomycetes]|uniref:sugar-binding transcriptional regulator n=1 Tax=Actinomycetes TaxID=1760 RepID=UPI000C4B730A|nr:MULTISPECIES: sugar-binding transcriptional regulator [Actinomycetes]MAU80627.1 DNA-binding transcriptional regulator [Gordonia sp. (in: high G+C Gram-positive bacteria)]
MSAHYGSSLDVHLRQLTKVAVMYHERGIRQAQIAETLGISQAKVSRSLKRAEDLGIIRTIVSIAPGLHPDLEARLETTFGLDEAVVVDIEDADRDDAAAVMGGIGSAAASYLEETFAAGERIGISSWSRTLLATVDRMRPLRTPIGGHIVQLLGGRGSSEAQAQSHRLAGDLARLIGAVPSYVQAPGVVADASLRERLLEDPGLAAVTAQWRELTTAVVGIGDVRPSALLADSGNAYGPGELEALLADGAVGDICHRVFRADGSVIHGPLDERTISIPAEEFRRIPRRIGVAGGPHKREPIRGALAGGWVTVLLTDVHTARDLIEGA